MVKVSQIKTESRMKIILLLLYLSTLIVCNQKLSEIEETTTELCSNGTEDICEAVNSSEASTVSPVEEVTNELTKAPVTTKRPKTITVKSTGAKKTTVYNTTGLAKPHPDCSCDTSKGDCEINCCCDIDCTAEQQAVFTHCIRVLHMVDSDHCFPQQLFYSNRTNYQTVETEPGVLCMLHQNAIASTDFTDVLVIRTVAALEKKLGHQSYFSWPNPLPTPLAFDTDLLYDRGSPIWITDNITITNLEFPASTGHSSVCHSSVIPKYLEEIEISCTTPIQTISDCISSGKTYFSIISSPRIFNFTQLQECTDDVCLPIQQYICSTTCFEGVVPHPTYNESTKTCHNLIESTEYRISHNGSQGIVKVKVFYTVKNISVHNNQLYRKYNKVSYVWAGSTNQNILKRSGRPGYEIRKPIISGNQAGKQVEYNYSASNWISVGLSGNSGLCLKRYNLLFGENIRTQCLLTVKGTCKQMQDQIWRQILGPAANLSTTMISSYGDPRPEEREAWVPLLSADLPPPPALTTAVNIIIVHSLVGHVALPQAKIVAVYLNFLPPTETCTSNQTQVAVETSVKFIDKTTPAVTKFAQPPVYEIKLPEDFFYPFLSSGCRKVYSKVIIVHMLFSLSFFIVSLVLI